jgi:hypothetical protein
MKKKTKPSDPGATKLAEARARQRQTAQTKAVATKNKSMAKR